MEKIKSRKEEEFSVEPYKSGYETRYRVVRTATGDIVDDAQGYGYKSIRNAWAAWSYKNRDKSKDVQRIQKEQTILDWMKSHKSFVRDMDEYAFEIAKGSWGPDDEFDVEFVKNMLKESGYTDLPFSARELYKIWCNGPKYAKKKRK